MLLWRRKEVQPKLAVRTSAGNERAFRTIASLCDPKIHLDELGIRHVVSDAILNSIAVDVVKLPESDCPHSDVFTVKAESGYMRGSFSEPCTKSEEEVMFQAALHKSAGPVSFHTVKTICRSASLSVSGTQENSRFCAESHVSSKELDASKCHIEKPLVCQPKISRTLERHCVSSPVVSTTHKDKSCIMPIDKAANERQEIAHKTEANCQVDDGSLESKKEQLQRSIARLEAKTLEGLQIGLVANLGTKKLSCGPSIQPTGSTSATSQSRPNSASESSKH